MFSFIVPDAAKMFLECSFIYKSHFYKTLALVKQSGGVCGGGGGGGGGGQKVIFQPFSLFKWISIYNIYIFHHKSLKVATLQKIVTLKPQICASLQCPMGRKIFKRLFLEKFVLAEKNQI